MVTTTADSGPGSLRQAILDANASPGPDSIAFNLSGTGPFTITPASPLPTITDPVVIDGSTQAGYAGMPLVEINGSNLAANSDGIHITAGGSTVRALAINRCPRDAIRIESLGTNVIEGNFLGTDPSGAAALPNGEGGVMINGSPGNIIGGTNASARNVISGGNQNGIYLLNSTAIGNVISGNYIGTSATGLAALGNVYNGLEISDCSSNLIGGAVAGAGNVISGNGLSGIYLLTSGATANVIEGNYIGLDKNGLTAVSNAQDGVTIYGVAGNTVGGTGAGAGNIISGNGAAGIDVLTAGATSNSILGNYIGADVTGKSAVPNQANGVIIDGAPGNTIGGTTAGAGNVISGNQQNGILIIHAGASNMLVQANFVGVDATGSNALANTYDGVTVDGAAGNLIGGANGGNVISGNRGNGVLLVDSGGGANQVQGNLIGTDYTGKTAVANAQAGIYIEVPGNTIGGPSAALRNVISGNFQNGIFIYGATASGNLIEGNYIGPDVTGRAALGNVYAGISISNAPATSIGGTSAGDGNVISGNGDSGITLGGSVTAATIIQGNHIGTDATGNDALPNSNGGIYLYGSGTNTIGGALAGAGNLISGNFQEGVSVGDPGANFNTIQGNFIGTKADGVSPLGNQAHNIDFLDTASNNLVGGTSPGADNRLAFVQWSLYDGVRVRVGCPGNSVSRNSIFSNGFLGIVIGPIAGINPTNMVTLTQAASDGATTGIQGFLTTSGAGQFLVQFYENIEPNKSGYGEGLTYIGATNVTTGADGHASFSLSLPVGVSPGRYLSATATDGAGTTWEFGPDYQVSSTPADGSIQVTISPPEAVKAGAMWQVDGAPFQGSGATTVNLSPGNHTIEFRPISGWNTPANQTVAIAAGATSTIAASYTVATRGETARLVVGANGLGVVSPNYNGKLLQIGNAYAIVALPGRNQMFSNWMGGAPQPLSVLSSNSELKFIMQSNLVLQANFVTNLFLAAAGSYNGLFAPADMQRAQGNSGFFTFQLGIGGAFSGRLLLASNALPLTGRFDVAGAARVLSTERDKKTLITTLQLDIANQAVNGTVSDGTFTAQLLGDMDIFGPGNKATNYAGRYTLIIQGANDPSVGPYGTSYAAVSVNTFGIVTLAGSLADGTPISQSSILSKDGYWPMYLPLYNGGESLWGWNYLSNRAIVSAPLTSWIKSTNSSKTALYRSGFTNQQAALTGSYYDPSAAPLLNFTNGEVLLEGGGLPLPITVDITLARNDAIIVAKAENTNRLTLQINKTTVIVVGSFIDPAISRQPIRLTGALRQSQDSAAGYFPAFGQSGSFLLQPR